MKESFYQPNVNHFLIVQSLHDGICERCFSDSKRHRNDFYGRIYCLDCSSFGLSTNQDVIYRSERRIEPRKHYLSLKFELTRIQKEGSAFFVNCLKNKTSGYLEAVCGAGKTEMLYDSILYGLQIGLRICISIPRRQVVEELTKRIRDVFPRTIIKELHQDAKDDESAHIIISTLQQLIRYYQEFDLMIIDEFDAFPLSGNPLLMRLIRKSLRSDGVLLVMSATRNEEGTMMIEKFHMKSFQIYERFHGQDLDIPKMILIRQLAHKLTNGILPKKLTQILDRWVVLQTYVFIFVPTISLGREVTQLLNHHGYQSRLFTSRTEYKIYELKDFEKRKTQIIVTTSILERGVTYPNLNVMVLFANHYIYTKEMLIQISGRVGRKRDFPHGEIIMISESIAISMEKAINHIKFMNQVKNNHEVSSL